MADDNSILWSPYTNLTVEDTWDAVNAKREPKNELDKDAFMQLLVTQMRYQDPLNPMDDKEFLGQMAQFNALEQMLNLNSTFAKTQAYAMMGKSVTGIHEDPTTGELTEVTGLVEAVTTKGSSTYLMVDGKEIALDTVTAVGDVYTDAIYSDISNTRAQAMVGKYVQALIQDSKGAVTDYVEGVVDYVKFNGSQSVLVVGTKEVLPGEVASISDKPLLIGKSIANGTITNVTIDGEKAVIHFDSGETQKLDKINYVMEAMSYVGSQIEHGDINGTVTQVSLKSGVPYLTVQTTSGEAQEISYKSFMGI
jgi:flagellar basal-body rod modification protein FlgD